jgi:hypothetical protein
MTPPLDPAGPALPGGGSGRAASGALRLPLAVAAAGLAAVTYLAVTDPYRPGGHLMCPVLALTGLYCAGCGAQRAVHSLAHGELGAAWDMNPLAVLLAPALALAWARWLRGRWRGTPPRRARGVRAASPWLVLVAVVGFAVLRNVPALAPVLAP